MRSWETYSLSFASENKGLGADFEDASVWGTKHTVGNAVLSYKTRLDKDRLMLLIVEVVAANHTDYVQIDHTPRCQHRLLIGIVERGQEVCHCLHTFLHAQMVASLGMAENVGNGSDEGIDKTCLSS